MRVAVIFVNYGPYHLARARGLAERDDVDAVFIELASAQRKYTWESDKRFLGDRLITLMPRPYEECPAAELSRKLVKVLSSLQPHAIVIAGFRDAPMRAAARWAHRTGVRIVMMSESNEEDHKRRWWKEWLKRRWIRRHVDTGFAGGKRAHAYLAKLGIPYSQIWEHYDVVDNAHFTLHADRLRAEADVLRRQAGLPPKYFLYVGRFAPEKNLLRLLEAYRCYRESHPAGWALVMVGDGPQRDQLRQAAAAMPEVVWPGFKQFDELPLYYAFAGCFVLPSTMEPWGLVVNEAMACGLPVIVSRRCGCAGDLMAEGRNGFTFEPTDSGQLARLMARMEALSGAQWEAMGLASREIISHWTPEVWGSQLACAIRAAVVPDAVR